MSEPVAQLVIRDVRGAGRERFADGLVGCDPTRWQLRFSTEIAVRTSSGVAV